MKMQDNPGDFLKIKKIRQSFFENAAKFRIYLQFSIV